VSAARTLSRKYAVLVGGLVVGALFLAGIIQAYFSYRDSRAAVSALTEEKALATALRIDDYVKSVVDQVAWVTMPLRDENEQALLQRRFEYRNLLKQVPAVTDIRQLDRLGREELLVSRTELDVMAAGTDYSQDPGFLAARSGALHFSPVYFRKGTEPYTRIAVPAHLGAETVALADLNLKFVWDSVSGIEFGRTGYAYVVDGGGRLIAHPDLKLVLQNTDFSRLSQSRPTHGAVRARSPAGTEIIAASAPMAASGWIVVVEQPIAEAYAPVYASLTRLGIVAALSLVLAALGALVTARRMAAPVKALETGAMQLAAGRLDHRVRVDTGDELEVLADQFNAMAETIGRSHEELEQKVEARTRELALANSAKSRFLAAASHDLRQPMHALGLFVAQLLAKPQTVEQRRLVDRIHASSQAMNALLDSLLDISRLDAGAVTPQAIDFPLDRLFARMRAEFEPLAQEKGLELRIASTSVWLRSDPVLLGRIVQNLISNAVRYTPRGGVLVGCRRRGAAVRIDVIDSGPGIPEEEREHVFREFYQLANPEHDRSKGLGLGLAIVERLARLLDHRVEIASRAGRGSRFCLTVTRGAPCSTAAPPEGIETGIPRGTLVSLIDDDALAREAMRGLMSSWGCEVVAAASAAEAALKLAAYRRMPDLIVSDFRLAGGGTGLQAIAQLRSAFGAQIPACLVTGDTSTDVLREIECAGLHALTKPVAPLRLRALVSQMLKARSVPQAAARFPA
jgi:signal transduction histidine kinase/ActR/RegA family two-component response regulator